MKRFLCFVLAAWVLFSLTVSDAEDVHFDKRYFDELAESPAALLGKEAGRRALERLNERAAESGKRYGEITEKRLEIPNSRKGYALPQGRFFLIVSKSVPEETLRTYAAQAEKLAKEGTSVTFLLRGFVGGIRRIGPTIRFYMSFALRDPKKFPTRKNLRPVELSIDPERTGSVSVVPALMDDKGCVVYGDAPLPYLIRKLSEGGCGKTFGATYAIAERDALEEIKEAAAKAAPQLARVRQKIVAKLRNVQGVDLPPALKDRTFRVRRIFTLRRDLRSPDGRTIARAGTYDLSASPVPLSRMRIFVVNSDDPRQTIWLEKELFEEKGFKTVLVAGRVDGICKRVSVPCYPLTAEVVRAFSLKGTPARISGSTGGTFVISEFRLGRGKSLPNLSFKELRRRRASASSSDLKPTSSTEGSGTKRTSPVKGSGAEFSSLGTKAMN